jgi:hypothetical protein
MIFDEDLSEVRSELPGALASFLLGLSSACDAGEIHF